MGVCQKGEPFKVIAALELLAVVVAVVCFLKEPLWKDAKGVVVCPGITDNSGNSYIVDRCMSTEFPLNFWLIVVAGQQNFFNFSFFFHGTPES